MSKLLFVKFALLVFVSASTAACAYDDPPHPCYESCTPWMQQLWQDYQEKGKQVQLTPAVYSGECRHLAEGYDPNYTHYAVVMLDQRADKSFYFSTIFAFFEPSNEFATWSLEDSRREMDSYWRDHGDLFRSENSTRVEIKAPDGSVGYVYWLRQDPNTGELFYITYGGISLKSFCRLRKNL